MLNKFGIILDKSEFSNLQIGYVENIHSLWEC